MTTRLSLAATAATVSTLLIAGHAWAQENDPCAGLTKKAKKLCVKYEDKRCSSETPIVKRKKCDKIAKKFEKKTGFPPPSECPCDFSLERIRGTVDGWDLDAPFGCFQRMTFDRTLPPPAIPTGEDLTAL